MKIFKFFTLFLAGLFSCFLFNFIVLVLPSNRFLNSHWELIGLILNILSISIICLFLDKPLKNWYFIGSILGILIVYGTYGFYGYDDRSYLKELILNGDIKEIYWGIN